MPRPKLLVTAPIARFDSVIKELNKNFELTIKEYLDYSKLKKIISNYEIMIPNARIKIDNNILKEARKLKVIYQPFNWI